MPYIWKVERIVGKDKKRWICRIVNMTLIVALVYIYGRNIPYLHSSFELSDEAVYIWNAAYFLGRGMDWEQIALTPYYGYGYSVLLIPLFNTASTGIQLIQKAYIINIVCVVGIFLVLSKLLTEMKENKYSLSVPLIVFTACLTPFIATNTIKVLCEVFLAFWYCLVVLLFYMALAYKKKIYFVLLGTAGVYIFFIHSRAIVVILTLFLLLFIIGLVCQKQKYLKLVLLTFVVAAVTFVLLFLIKNNIITYKEAIKQVYQASMEDGNLLSTRFENLRYLIPIKSFLCFWTKVSYVIYASGGVVLPGGICVIKSFAKSVKSPDLIDQKYAESYVKIFIIISFVLMLIASTMLGQGGDIRYTFYGRYYEYMLPTVISICVYSVLFEYKNLSIKETLGCAVFVVMTGLETKHYCMYYLEDKNIRIDTARLDAFSRAIVSNDNLESMLLYIVVISTGILFLYSLILQHKNYRYLVILIVLSVSWSNSAVCIDKIKESHDRLKGDSEIALYIYDHSESEDLYIIGDDTLSTPDYQRTQILMKDKKIRIISKEEIEALAEDAYVLVSSKSEYPDNEDLKFIQQGFAFALYQK